MPHEVIARLDDLEQLTRLLLEVDPFERRGWGIAAPCRHPERVLLRKRPLRLPPGVAARAVDQHDPRARAHDLDVQLAGYWLLGIGGVQRGIQLFPSQCFWTPLPRGTSPSWKAVGLTLALRGAETPTSSK